MCLAPPEGLARLAPTRVRGLSLVEMMAALLILAIVTAASFTLYWSGNQSHRRARFYSRAQTDVRTALREVTREVRSAQSVRATGSQGTLSGLTSNANQLVVRRIQGAQTYECRYYVSNGVLYRQRSVDAAPGTALLTDVTGLTFRYFRTLAGSRTNVDGAPGTASEVEFAVQARRGTVTTGLTMYVALRQVLTGG